MWAENLINGHTNAQKNVIDFFLMYDKYIGKSRWEKIGLMPILVITKVIKLFKLP